MKYLLISVLSICSSYNSFAGPPCRPLAGDTLPPPLSSYKSVIIRMETSWSDYKERIPRQERSFGHFTVLDLRADTSRIGIHNIDFKWIGSRNRQIVFAGPAAGEITNYLNGRFSNKNASLGGLIVIRSLWLSDANNLREDFVRDPEQRKLSTKIRFKAEAYACKAGVYTPLFRFDTLQTSEKEPYGHFGKDLAGILDDLADSMDIMFSKKWETGRKLSLEDIQHFNQSRFDPPINNDSIPIRGVFASFEEFKKNSPSIRDFELKKDHGNLILYINEPGGKSNYSHTAWGICDGAHVYVMRNGCLYQAWREGNGYYLVGPADLGLTPYVQHNPSPTPGVDERSSSTYATIPGGAAVNIPTVNPGSVVVGGMMAGVALEPLLRRRVNKEKHIFAVDMDNGNLY